MIDLRSDTVTLPTPEMKEVMMVAPLGDDVFGEDPSITELEEKAAAMFGMEKGLFCPSGTMTNQIAIRAHVSPGDEVICSRESHVYCYEGGGIASNSGASVRLIAGDSGLLTAGDIHGNFNNPEDIHLPLTKLVSVENTSNRGGGVCYDFEELKRIKVACDQYKLGFHLDGARIFNAIVAKNENPLDYGGLFDSISVCLSKGLGAPVGSVLLGNVDFIKKARRIRKVFGGGMRQAGVIASAGSYALENNVKRLKVDHENAKIIAKAALENSLVKRLLPVETNIIVIELNDSISQNDFLEKLMKKKVLGVGFGPQRIRLVTHLNLSPENIEEVCDVLNYLE